MSDGSGPAWRAEVDAEERLRKERELVALRAENAVLTAQLAALREVTRKAESSIRYLAAARKDRQ